MGTLETELEFDAGPEPLDLSADDSLEGADALLHWIVQEDYLQPSVPAVIVGPEGQGLALLGPHGAVLGKAFCWCQGGKHA